MNITLNKFIILIFLLPTLLVSMQNDSLFRCTSEIIFGYPAKSDTRYRFGGFSPGIRFMWEPDKKLNLGIETAFMQVEKHFFDVNEQNYQDAEKANLNAIPILLVFDWEIWKLNFYGGLGASYVWTRLDTKDDLVISSQWNYTIMLASGYTYYLSSTFGLGIETKYFLLSKLEKEIISLNLKIKLSLYSW